LLVSRRLAVETAGRLERLKDFAVDAAGAYPGNGLFGVRQLLKSQNLCHSTFLLS
jgi:hypothetical protein